MNDWRGVRDSSGALLLAPNATWVTVFDYSMQTVHLVFLACTDLQGHQELLTDYGEVRPVHTAYTLLQATSCLKSELSLSPLDGAQGDHVSIF